MEFHFGSVQLDISWVSTANEWDNKLTFQTNKHSSVYNIQLSPKGEMNSGGYNYTETRSVEVNYCDKWVVTIIVLFNVVTIIDNMWQ